VADRTASAKSIEVPEGWFVDLTSSGWVLSYEQDENVKVKVLEIDNDYIVNVDGCQNIAPISAVKAFIWAVENNAVPLHAK
jgi:hypothetical protein